MSTSKSIPHLACVIALLGCISLISHVAVADEADEAEDLTNAIFSHLRDRLPATAGRVSATDEGYVRAFARSILKMSYYPVDPQRVAAAANAAIDKADQRTATVSSLVRAALTAALESLGHGSRVFPHHGTQASAGDDAEPLPLPQARQVGLLWVVSLSAMMAPDSNTRGECIHDYGRYFDGFSKQTTRGIVLDLRGNEGGYLPDSACLASLFVAPGAELFQVVDKKGLDRAFKSESSGRDPLTLPLLIFIDKRTDSGGLLLAATLQDRHRAKIIGVTKSDINGTVYSLLRPKILDADVKFPMGEVMLPGNRPLTEGVRVDVTVPAQNEEALMNAARATLASSS